MVSYIPGGGPYSTSLLYAICRVSETDSSAQDISLYEINTHFYYSFKIFSRFWLVKTTCIIHNNQLLFTKFGKNLRNIESMTSKVEPSENYWTNDVKILAILNQWRQKLLNRWPRKPGDKVALYLVSGKTKSVMAKLL